MRSMVVGAAAQPPFHGGPPPPLAVGERSPSPAEAREE